MLLQIKIRGLAQLVEQRPPKPFVGSSSLSSPAIQDIDMNVKELKEALDFINDDAKVVLQDSDGTYRNISIDNKMAVVSRKSSVIYEYLGDSHMQKGDVLIGILLVY